MAETDSTEAPLPYREITLTYDGADWTHRMKEPTDGQTVQILGLIDAKGVAQPGATPEQQAALRRRTMDAIRTARRLAQGLHYDEEEWTRLSNALSMGTCDDGVMYAAIINTLEAWGQGAPNNRAERRAKAKATPKARRVATP